MNKVDKIFNLLKPFVKQGNILPRGKQQINHNIQDFICLSNGNDLIACSGLKRYEQDNIGEIYAFAVLKKLQHMGLSSKLLAKVIFKAKQSNYSKIFALTKYNTDWFIKNGFTQMSVSDLPEKRQISFDYKRNSLIFFKNIS